MNRWRAKLGDEVGDLRTVELEGLHGQTVLVEVDAIAAALSDIRDFGG